MSKVKKFKIKNDTIIQRDLKQEFQYIDGEIVMLSLKNGEYYGLDKLGTKIWEVLEKPIKFSILIDILTMDYNVEAEECISDTKVYLEELFNKNLLVVNL